MNVEQRRLEESRNRQSYWKRWGPYVSERAWGTVREDYSATGEAWEFFPHDHARSRAYRWNEDGIGGICDRHQMICLGLALWNGNDAILKERLFGLSGNEGNHGEDVKEYYFYLDSTPTHSYMKMLYKYPQRGFPYGELVAENRRRTKDDPEFELLDTGVFEENRYFDVEIEYAKADTEDILTRITVTNRGPEAAPIHVLPTIWFRNTWSWFPGTEKPLLKAAHKSEGLSAVSVFHQRYGQRWLYCYDGPELLFCENETNSQRLWGTPGPRYPKDGINDYIIHGADTVHPERMGTKASAHYQKTLQPGESFSVRLRFTPEEWPQGENPLASEFDGIFATRKLEADNFYESIAPHDLSEDARNVLRQSFGGLMWTKQFYHLEVKQWLQGDPAGPPPPESRQHGRNHDWQHLYNEDILSMPDKWEYPWYAAWDLAFHTIPLALVDSDFAKEQLVLMLREWYMHPNGQIPAYEWAFGDVNPPVHAWAAWRVYKIDKKNRNGKGDRQFLERVFHKLMLNFTWWVNRKDAEGRNLFQGGFLGLDNIGVFDRSAPLPTGGYLEQSDGTAWMAMYTLNLFAIAMELAREDHAYEDVASKFWEHFLYIANAMSHRGQDGLGMWDDVDGFFYDVLHLPDDTRVPMRLRTMVGLIPLFAVEIMDSNWLEKFDGFRRRMDWFIENRPDLTGNIAAMEKPGHGARLLLSICDGRQLRSVLEYMLDEREFLSDYGIRALSKIHEKHPYVLEFDGHEHRVDYQPAESRSGLFGGNSNWRGPIWFPLNFLLIESLQRFHHYLGDDFKVECPTGSGQMMTLQEVGAEISRRLSRIFLRGADGRRPVAGDIELFQSDPHWRDLVLFHEYFHGDNGAGLGASHQTGWTALVAKLLIQSGEKNHRNRKKDRAETVVAATSNA
jgi:Glycosyl hydrolase family 63 C-terminal domain